MKKFRNGQGTLEYVIILACIIGAIIAVAAMLKPKILSSYTNLTNQTVEKIGNITL